MYNVLTTILAVLAITLTLPHVDGGWLFIAGLCWGSATLGSVITVVAMKGE